MAVVQKVKPVVWQPEGCWFDPQLLLVESEMSLPKQENLTITAPKEL